MSKNLHGKEAKTTSLLHVNHFLFLLSSFLKISLLLFPFLHLIKLWEDHLHKVLKIFHSDILVVLISYIIDSFFFLLLSFNRLGINNMTLHFIILWRILNWLNFIIDIHLIILRRISSLYIFNLILLFFKLTFFVFNRKLSLSFLIDQISNDSIYIDILNLNFFILIV